MIRRSVAAGARPTHGELRSRFAAAPWPVLLAGLVGLALSFSEAWHGLELKLFDRLSVLAAPNEARLPITLVGIDEESMAQIARQWPWPRGQHGRLLDRLREAGAAVVAFDLVFAEPSPDAREDREFARAIRDFGPVVLAANLEYRESTLTRQWLRVDPLPEFLGAGAVAGLATLKTDADGIQRDIPLSQGAFWREVVAAFDRARPGTVRVPAVDEGDRIRYAGGPGTFAYIPYHRLLEPERHLSPNWREFLRDNIVLVGRALKAAPELNAVQADMFFTPFFFRTQTLMPGVEVQANIIASVIEGRALRAPPRAVAAALVLVVTALSWLATRHWHPVSSGLWASTLAAAVLALDWFLFRYQSLWLPAMAALATIALAYVGQGGAGYLQERARRAAIRRAFSLYVAPAIVDEIVAHPDRLQLAGDRRELTLLFTDLAGFSGIAESLPAEDVARMLNRHLTEMTEIVLHHHGTVDKFIGDAVMAFWGAPVADPDQSLHAVQAALAMQARMQAMRAEVLAAGGPELRMRIGLHRGECIVGNLGGSGRFAYTAVGDCVNLAARLEGVNAVYGTGILLSETVARAVEHAVPLRPVDTVRVKGRQQPVSVFSPSSDPGLAAATADALAAYRRGDWISASGRWKILAASYPEDPVAAVFVGRLRAWSTNGWPAAWDGVTTLESK